MLLGFISLFLTVSQSFISDICIPERSSFHMLPCNKERSTPVEVIHHRVSSEITWKRQRLLSGDFVSDHCASQGKVQLLSLEALHQLHILIFVLAVVHVLFCATTMVLGGARIRQWKLWEKEIHREISSPEKIPSTDPQSLSQHNHEFVLERAAGIWMKSAVLSRIMCFFKQFYGSVTKSDYKALRSGFIMSHCPTHPKFDFHKYMIRALEDDFKKVVGISWYLWLFVIIFLLINIHACCNGGCKAGTCHHSASHKTSRDTYRWSRKPGEAFRRTLLVPVAELDSLLDPLHSISKFLRNRIPFLDHC
ncbi:MLO-like protein 13 [Platanthera guangdongensis]|uniref:MLO-like protein 13 n=1 Tax=Platanthera guangdongensis TaxID=2320717 RepID=A0ABR2MDX6_9ASPA